MPVKPDSATPTVTVRAIILRPCGSNLYDQLVFGHDRIVEAKWRGRVITQKSSQRFWLAIGWLLLVAGWSWWEYSHFSGLYRWLADWQIAQWGGYERIWTALVPAVVLAIPAIRFLRERELLNQAAPIAGADPAAMLGRVRTGLLICGGILTLVAGGACLYSQSLPDPSDPPVAIDLAALGGAAPPTGSAIFAGALPDTDRALQMDEAFRSRSADIDHQTIYVPVVAKGAAGNAPVRFLIDRASYAFTYSREAPRTNIIVADHMQGVLVENGLPADVVAAFERQGVTIASPHYLMTTNSVGGRQPYYIVAALGGFTAFILLLLAVAQSVSIARARRPQKG